MYCWARKRGSYPAATARRVPDQEEGKLSARHRRVPDSREGDGLLPTDRVSVTTGGLMPIILHIYRIIVKNVQQMK